MTTETVEKSVTEHAVVPHDEWLAARIALMAREKELTRLQDQIASERRALPWERVDKRYVLETPQGQQALVDLFAGRRQLIVQHFMFGPGWPQGCPSCSFMADHSDAMAPHLAARDITLIAVSRAPIADIERFRQRMGWRFTWASSNQSDFNRDFGVSFSTEDRVDGEVVYNYRRTAFPADEAPGISVFYRDDAEQIFHTYSTFGRGVEVMMGSYPMIDLTPKGRDENDGPYKMDWVRHHDRYASTSAYERSPEPVATATAASEAARPAASCCARRE